MGGRSKTKQTAEGDLIYNNIDYGGGASGPLKNVNIGRGNTVSGNTLNVTDGGAISGALGAAEATSKAALGSNEATAARAIEAGLTGQLASAQLADNIAKEVGRQATEANQAMAEMAAEQARQNAAQMKNTINAIAGANGQLAQVANASQNNMAALSADSMERFADMSEGTLSTYGSLFGDALSAITGSNVTAQEQTEKAMDYVFQSTKTATERTSENMLKYAGYAAVAIVLIVMLSRKR